MGKGKRFNTSDPTANQAIANVDAELLRRRDRIRQAQEEERNERIRRAREQAGPDDDSAA